MTADLTEFILNRIAEDEAVARAALRYPSSEWRADEYGEVYESDHFDAADRCSEHPPGVPNMCDDERIAAGFADDDAPELEAARGAHIVRHDPARVLAECAALRRIVARYEQAERLRQANAEKHAEVSRGGLDNQEQIMALRVHGYELQGRLDGLLYAVTALAGIWSDHPDYRPEEWA